MATSQRHNDRTDGPDADLLEGLTGAERKMADLAYKKLRSELDRGFRRQVATATSEVDLWVNRVVAAAGATQHRFDDQVGPFYDTSRLRSWTRISRQAISGQIRRHSLIACQLEGGTWVYPVWQFNDDGSVKGALIDVWRTLRGPTDRPNADQWTCALWMRAPHSALEGRSPVDWIDNGGSIDVVVTLARQVGARWAR